VEVCFRRWQGVGRGYLVHVECVNTGTPREDADE
jgi:hypothetical protein